MSNVQNMPQSDESLSNGGQGTERKDHKMTRLVSDVTNVFFLEG